MGGGTRIDGGGYRRGGGRGRGVQLIISSGGACVFDKKPAEAASTFTPLSSVVYTPESGGGQGERRRAPNAKQAVTVQLYSRLYRYPAVESRGCRT